MVLGVFLVAAGVGAGLLMLYASRTHSEGVVGAGTMGAFLLFLGGYIIVGVLRERMVLEPDAIEIRGTLTTRRMRREDIAGRRRIAVQGRTQIRLVSRFAQQKDLAVIPQYKTDAAFDAWFDGIPDLDASEAQASLDELLDDPNLMGTRGEKLSELTSARRVARYLTIATVVVCAWFWLYPHPRGLVLACVATLPWVAASIAASRPFYRLNPKRNEVRANLALPYVLPCFALAARGLFETRVLDVQQLVTLGAAATAVCVLLMALLLREARHSLAVTCVFMGIYAFGAVSLANQQLDLARPETHEAKVLDSRVSSGRHTYYYLRLAPWGPLAAAEEVSVTKDLYERTSDRKTVCVYLHRGALRVRWFEVEDCRRGPRGSP